MKLNWGTGIVITIIVFLIISFAMIFHFMNQRVDLVTDNYYEKTLVYQKQIDEAERSKQFDKDIQLEYASNQLKISFPDSLVKNLVNGQLLFYRPSDSNKDFKTSFQLNDAGETILDVSTLERGYWKLQLNWFIDNESYSIERSLMIN
ncbi:MAG: FixH family protein [Ignavibacteriaceae bacterium]|nr:FixH family protein [Ignavibacteriaceae bacterium]